MAKNRWINVKRYRQIIDVFAKNGFGLLMDQLGLFNYLKLRKKLFHAAGKPEHLKYSTGERLRMSFEELGPTFIKLGQIMSTRQDIFPSDIAEELKKLQDFVRPFPFAEVREVIESEFDDKLENIYKEFDEKPFAAASLSQVHHARLNSGKEAAVKVQRPGIEKVIDLDLHILKDLAHFMDNHTKYGQMYDFSTVAAEFENTMKNELDFTKEGENTDKFKENFLNDDGITVPEIKWIYTSSRVITMEYIEGIRVDDCESLEQAGIDRKLLARKLASSICNQILRDGFFHADPHPGNILILHDGTIVFIDCGMVGMLSESQKRIISDFFIGVATKDSKLVVKSILDLDSIPKKSNIKKFEKDVDKIIEKYLTLPWKEINIADLFYEIFNMAFLNHIKIPSEFALLSKTLVTLQGLLEKLDPDLNTLDVARPIAKKMIYQSFSLKNLGKDIRKSLINYKNLFIEFPSFMLDFFKKMEDEDFIVQFEIKDVDNIQKQFVRIFNRICFSIILLAVSIIIAAIIIGTSINAGAGSGMYLLNAAVLQIGLFVAGVILLGLIISIFRSGRL